MAIVMPHPARLVQTLKSEARQAVCCMQHGCMNPTQDWHWHGCQCMPADAQHTMTPAVGSSASPSKSTSAAVYCWGGHNSHHPASPKQHPASPCITTILQAETEAAMSALREEAVGLREALDAQRSQLERHYAGLHSKMRKEYEQVGMVPGCCSRHGGTLGSGFHSTTTDEKHASTHGLVSSWTPATACREECQAGSRPAAGWLSVLSRPTAAC